VRRSAHLQTVTFSPIAPQPLPGIHVHTQLPAFANFFDDVAVDSSDTHRGDAVHEACGPAPAAGQRQVPTQCPVPPHRLYREAALTLSHWLEK
jgi:hypothetical protein